MRSDLFYWVLNMSILGALLCLIVLLLRRIRTLPRLFVYGLWALPFARLVCPVGLTGRCNLMEQLTRLGARRVPAEQLLGAGAWNGPYLTEADGVGLASMMNCTQLAQSYSPLVYAQSTLRNAMEAAALIWLAVAAVLVLVALLLYRFSAAEGRLAVKEGEYYVSDRVKAPAVYGIFRGRIVLPESVRQEDIPYILCHERVHLRRRDNLWRCAAVLVCCVHWFNPVCWLSLRCFFADMELACDAAAARSMTQEQRKRYTHTILNAASEQSLFTSAFGGAKVSARIWNLLSYRKLTVLSTVAFALLFAVAAYVLVTN